jgi:hypothetical protein
MSIEILKIVATHTVSPKGQQPKRLFVIYGTRTGYAQVIKNALDQYNIPDTKVVTKRNYYAKH